MPLWAATRMPDPPVGSTVMLRPGLAGEERTALLGVIVLVRSSVPARAWQATNPG